LRRLAQEGKAVKEVLAEKAADEKGNFSIDIHVL